MTNTFLEPLPIPEGALEEVQAIGIDVPRSAREPIARKVSPPVVAASDRGTGGETIYGDGQILRRLNSGYIVGFADPA